MEINFGRLIVTSTVTVVIWNVFTCCSTGSSYLEGLTYSKSGLKITTSLKLVLRRSLTHSITEHKFTSQFTTARVPKCTTAICTIDGTKPLTTVSLSSFQVLEQLGPSLVLFLVRVRQLLRIGLSQGNPFNQVNGHLVKLSLRRRAHARLHLQMFEARAVTLFEPNIPDVH